MRAYTSPGKTFWFFKHKRLVAGILGVVVAAAILLADQIYNRHDVRIFADGKVYDIVMRDGTVQDSISKAKIEVADHDLVVPPLESAVQGDMKVEITRTIPVTVISDGQTNLQWVPVGSMVAEVLAQAQVPVGSGDQVVPALSQVLNAGGDIEVTRVAEKFIQESVKVPYKTLNQNDERLEKGLKRIAQKGQDGLIQRTIKVTMENGKEVKREVVEEKTVKKPVDRIVAVGTLAVKTVSRGSTIRYSRVMEMNASGYTYTGNNMYSGVSPYRGAVAVDPKVIPLGTMLYVEGYGNAKAMDIGSAIKGNKIDLFFETESEALRWGRRNVKVYILEQ